MAEQRTTERAESMFDYAFRFMDGSSTKDRNSNQGQHALYMAMGMKELSKAIREVYDKLEQIDKKLSTRP
jgi:hypothetical protein